MMDNNTIELRSEDLVFLLGAGVSKNAGIPISKEMVKMVENLINEKWRDFKDLYYYLKSSILYSKGIFGEFDNSNFNIENLLVIISNLKEKDKNPIYPFIGSWDLRLIDLAGKDFAYLKEFDKKIREELINWVTPRQYTKANYFKGFMTLKNQITQTLKIFTLNYDLCFEKIIGESLIETGFGGGSEWHYTNFNEIDNPKDFFLYKLHGSIDWYINETTKKLNKNDNIEIRSPQLIFGVEHKLQSIDPYFYYSSELRNATLECKLILAIGYGYEDIYINKILSQALQNNKNITLLSVQPLFGASEDDIILKNNELKIKIMAKLDIEEQQLYILDDCAEVFLQQRMTKEFLNEYIKNEIF